MNNNILKAVGGLEAAQKIVDEAPKDAEYLLHRAGTYYKVREGIVWACHKNPPIWILSARKLDCFESADFIRLGEIHGAIIDHYESNTVRREAPQILVRPDEAEILPQCAACATKDHDLNALRKLQASNLSIYAGRVHSQQTHILIYEVIIGVLVIALIGLVLWGLK